MNNTAYSHNYAQTIISDYEPDGAVLEAFYNSWRYGNVCIGPLGSGKTIASIHKIQTAICEQPIGRDGVRRSRWLTVRNNQNDLEGTTIKDWFEIMPVELGHYSKESPKTHYMDFDGDDGVRVVSEMIFLPLDLEKSLKKLRGYQLTGIWFNEMKELLKSIVTLGMSRTGRYPRQADMLPLPGQPTDAKRYWSGAIGDTNSPSDDHWLHDLWDKQQAGELHRWRIFKQPGGLIRDPATKSWIANPAAENMTALYADYYTEKIDDASDAFVKVNLANEFGTFVEGKAVHPEYNDEFHSAGDIQYIPGLDVYVGVDFGRTPAAAIFQIVAGGYQVFDEYITQDTAANTMARELRLHLARTWGITKGVKGTADPAGRNKTESSEFSAIELMRAEGFDIYASPIANTNTVLRRKALTDPLTRIRADGRPATLIATRCKTLRAGLAGQFYYRRAAINYDTRYKSEPEKNLYSHICEALEYGFAGCGEGRIVQTNSTKPTKRRHSTNRRIINA